MIGTKPILRRNRPTRVPPVASFLMSVLVLTLGFYFVYPILLIAINSFNLTPSIVQPPTWGLDNWRVAFQTRDLFEALWNTIYIFVISTVLTFPLAVFIAWALARVRMPFSYGLEFLFWVAYMVPGISITVGWILLADPDLGFINRALRLLPFIDEGVFNIFSVKGIIWAHVMGRGIASQVMLLTPAFRNMDVTLEEAARMSGASNMATMMRVTMPVMLPPLVVVFALRVTHVFDSFETEQLLGVPFGFFVYSTKIFELARQVPPQSGQATALASITLAVVALIIPFQRWLLHRRAHTTVTGQFKPGRIDLGVWGKVIFWGILLILFVKIIAPVLSLLLGSVMFRAGIFALDHPYTLDHWRLVLTDGLFRQSVRNTFFLATTAAIVSPILFSIIGYIIVRTKWSGRILLDSVIWISAAIPGMLSGLGLLWMFVGTPVLHLVYGTLVPLIIVVIIQGNTTGTQLSKAVFLQMGADMEEQARVSGAGWTRTYLRVWLPLIAPTLILLATLNFVTAATTTSSIILLADRGTLTMSILALEFARPEIGMREEAGIVSLFIMLMAVSVALVARGFGLRVGIRERPYAAPRAGLRTAASPSRLTRR